MISACDRLGQALPGGAFLLSWWLELALAAGLFALLLVLLARITGLGGKIRIVRRKMIAATEEILLYRRRPLTVIRAELKLVGWNAVLLLILAPLLVVGGGIFKAAYGSLDNRYGFAPAKAGEALVVRAYCPVGSLAGIEVIEASGAGRSVLVTACVRSAARQTVWSRLRPDRAGLYSIHLPGTTDEAFLNVGFPDCPAMPQQQAGDVDIRIGYPPRKMFGLRHGWTLVFFVMCIAAAWPMSLWLRVAV